MFIIESFTAIVGPNVEPENRKIILNIVEYDDDTGVQLQDDTMEIYETLPRTADMFAEDPDEDEAIGNIVKGWRKLDKADSKLFDNLHKAMDKWLRDAIEKGDKKSTKHADKKAGKPGWMKKLQE